MVSKDCFGQSSCYACRQREACFSQMSIDTKIDMLVYNDETYNTAVAYNNAPNALDAVMETEAPGNTLALDIPEEARETVMEVVRAMATTYLYQPKAWDRIVRGIYQGMSDADISRLRGITRQQVSKELQRECQVPIASALTALITSVPADIITAWRLMQIEGKSQKEAARLMRVTPGRLSQILSAAKKEYDLDLQKPITVWRGRLRQAPMPPEGDTDQP